MNVFVLFCLLVLVSCSNKNDSPEAVLKDFVEAQASLMPSIKSQHFKLISKSCHINKCLLTYSVGYSTQAQAKTTFMTQVQKKAEMLQVENKWLIAEVSNLDTTHESIEPINL